VIAIFVVLGLIGVVLLVVTMARRRARQPAGVTG